MLNTARTAVVGYVVWVGNDVLLHDCAVDISVVDDGDIHLCDRGVIRKGPTLPGATEEADSTIAEAVIHAAIVADLPTPIPIMESILAASPSPIGGGPQGALIGGRHPRAGNPIIVPIVGGVAPVTRGPQEVGLRTRWLLIDGQSGRSKSDIDAYTNPELGVKARRYQ